MRSACLHNFGTEIVLYERRTALRTEKAKFRKNGDGSSKSEEDRFWLTQNLSGRCFVPYFVSFCLFEVLDT